jgi:uncharacterized protein (DUF1778 family)
MPNQRKKGKKLVAVWLTVEERKALKSLAESNGLDVTSFIKQIALNTANERTNNEKGSN